MRPSKINPIVLVETQTFFALYSNQLSVTLNSFNHLPKSREMRSIQVIKNIFSKDGNQRRFLSFPSWELKYTRQHFFFVRNDSSRKMKVNTRTYKKKRSSQLTTGTNSKPKELTQAQNYNYTTIKNSQRTTQQ